MPVMLFIHIFVLDLVIGEALESQKLKLSLYIHAYILDALSTFILYISASTQTYKKV